MKIEEGAIQRRDTTAVSLFLGVLVVKLFCKAKLKNYNFPTYMLFFNCVML